MNRFREWTPGCRGVLGAWRALRSAVRRGSEPTSARVRWVAARPTGNEAAGSKAAHQRPTLQLPAELPGGGGWWLKENEPTSGGRLAEGRQRGGGGGGGRPAKSESTLGRSQRLGYCSTLAGGGTCRARAEKRVDTSID